MVGACVAAGVWIVSGSSAVVGGVSFLQRGDVDLTTWWPVAQRDHQ